MWDKIKKSINSNLEEPLNELINNVINNFNELIEEKSLDIVKSVNTDSSGDRFLSFYENRGVLPIAISENLAKNMNYFLMDEEYIYAFTQGQSGTIFKIKKNDLTKVIEITVPIQSVCMDETTIYTGDSASTATQSRLRRYGKSDVSYLGQSPALGGAIWGVEADNNFVYALNRNTKAIIKLNKFDLTIVSNGEVFGTFPRSLGMDIDFLYVGTDSELIKVRKDTLNVVGVATVTTQGSINYITLDDDFIYCSSGAFVRKFAKSNFQLISEINLTSTVNGLYLDNKELYVAHMSLGSFVVLNKNDLSFMYQSHKVGDNAHLNAIVIDGDFAYFGGSAVSSRSVHKSTKFELYEKLGYRRV